MGRRRMMGKSAGGISPDSAPDGAYICTDDRRLFTPDMWNTLNNNKVSGIAIIHEGVKYVMALVSYSGQWSSINESVNGVSIADSVELAKTQYDGISNTNAIVAKNYANAAANTCSYFTFKHGQSGYLGSFGEWYKVMYYQAMVMTISNLLGASYQYGGTYWASTEYYYPGQAWTFRASPYSYTTYYKNTTINFIPFAKL